MAQAESTKIDGKDRPQNLTGVDDASLEQSIKTLLAQPELKISKSRLTNLFESIGSHTLMLSLEGRQEEFLVFTSLHISLLIKCAPNFEDRLIPLCHATHLHLSNIPKNFSVLTVKNNLITAMIHFHKWKLAYDQAKILCQEIEEELKTHPNLQREMTKILEKEAIKIELDLHESDRKLLILLLSTYLNMILGGRGAFKGKIDELSKLIPIIQKGYKISNKILCDEEFSRKFKQVLKSLISPPNPISCSQTKVDENAKKKSKSRSKDSGENQKSQIVKEICGENFNIGRLRKKSTDSSLKQSSFKYFMAASKKSSKGSKFLSNNLNKHSRSGNSPIDFSDGNFSINSKNGEGKFIKLKMQKSMTNPSSFKLMNSKKKQKLDKEDHSSHDNYNQTVPEADPLNEETINKDQSKIKLGTGNLESPSSKVSKKTNSVIIKKRISTQIRSLTDAAVTSKAPEFKENKEDKIRKPSICLHARDVGHSEVGTEFHQEEIDSRSMNIPLDHNIMNPRKDSNMSKSKATLRSIILMDDKDKKKEEKSSKQIGYRRNKTLNNQDENPRGTSIMLPISPQQTPIKRENSGGQSEHRASHNRPQTRKEDSEEAMSITIKKQPKIEIIPNDGIPMRESEKKDPHHNQTLKHINERNSRARLSMMPESQPRRESQSPNLVRSFNIKSSKNEIKNLPEYERSIYPLPETTDRGLTEVHTVSSQANYRPMDLHKREEINFPFQLQTPVANPLGRSFYMECPSRSFIQLPSMTQLPPNSFLEKPTTPPSNTNKKDLVKEYMSIKNKAEIDHFSMLPPNQTGNLVDVIGDRTALLQMVDRLLSENRDLQVKLKIKSGVNSAGDSGDFTHSSVNVPENLDENKQNNSKPARPSHEKLGSRSVMGNYMIHGSKSSTHIDSSQKLLNPNADSPNNRKPGTATRLEIPRSYGFSMKVEELSSRPKLDSFASISQSNQFGGLQPPAYIMRGHRSSTNIPTPVTRVLDNKDRTRTSIYNIEDDLFGNRKENLGMHLFCPNWDQYKQNFFGESVKVVRIQTIEGCGDMICSYIKAKTNERKDLVFEVATYISGDKDAKSPSPGSLSFKAEDAVSYSAMELAPLLESLDLSFIDIYPNSVAINYFVEFLLRYVLIRYVSLNINYETKSVRTEIRPWPPIVDCVSEVFYQGLIHNANLIYAENRKFWICLTMSTNLLFKVKLRFEVTFDKQTFEDCFSVSAQHQDITNDNSLRLKLLDFSNIKTSDKAAVDLCDLVDEQKVHSSIGNSQESDDFEPQVGRDDSRLHLGARVPH